VAPEWGVATRGVRMFRDTGVGNERLMLFCGTGVENRVKDCSATPEWGTKVEGLICVARTENG